MSRSRGRAAVASVVLLIVLISAGCGMLSDDPVLLDGLSIGGTASCGACDQPQTSPNCGTCEGIAAIARRHVDETWPNHPPLATLTFHHEGYYPGPSGERILNGRSGSLTVAVATFTDGTRHAVSVYCGVGGCR